MGYAWNEEIWMDENCGKHCWVRYLFDQNTCKISVKVLFCDAQMIGNKMGSFH